MGNLCSVSISAHYVVSRCWDCIAGYANYILQLKENLKALESEVDRLRELRDDVKTKVILAEAQNMKRLNQVQGWLSRVEKMIAESEKLIRDSHQQSEAGCLSNTCCSSYKLGREVAKKVEDVAKLKSEGDFKEVVEKASVAQMNNLRPTQLAVGLESTFDKVWSCLWQESVGMIGIYGMGGVGKTTLLTQIYNKLQGMPHGFDVVIWATVSKDLRLKEVQEDIGKMVGFSYEELKFKRLDENAANIFSVLGKKRFVLLLDDIWERVDLTKLGIPLPNQENGSKLIFTTRFLGVCGQMEAQEKVKVDCLAPEKAWVLFQEKIGKETLESCHSDIPMLAKELAKECDGLPLALITIGRAMACKKTPEEWKYAIDVLRRSASSVLPGMGREVYPVLKFSYDCLASDMVRSCFLYCSLFPEDHLINKNYLIDYWIAEGFLDEHEGIRAGTRNQGHFIIGSLLQACLLEAGMNEEYVKMHDVIRDMALWIACELEEQHKCFVRAGAGLIEAPEVKNWEKVKRLSLMENRIRNLTGKPACYTTLGSLFLQDNRLKVINDEVFQSMPNLTVLDLSKNREMKEVPVGISKLVSLEYLNLSRTSITQLPIEFKSLTELKCLNLDGTMCLHKIPQQLISSFRRLQVFRMCGIYNSASGSSNEVIEGNILSGGNEFLVEELQSLKHLDTLTITIKSDFALQRFLSFHSLQSCTEVITLALFKNTKSLDIGFLANMKRLRIVEFVRLKSLEELKTGTIVNPPRKTCFFHGLRRVVIFGCSELRELTWVLLAPNLSSLVVQLCRKVEEIINEGKLSQFPEVVVGNLNPFAKLEILILSCLPKLKSIYWHALSFPRLNIIKSYGCPKLRKLSLNSESAKGQKLFIYGEDDWWKEVEWEDEATANNFHRCFMPFKPEIIDGDH